MNQSSQDDDFQRFFSQNENSSESFSADEGLTYLKELLSEADSDSINDLPLGIRAMLQTALKYPESSITDPIVAKELVEAILQDQYGAQSLDSKYAAEMFESISQALLEDPTANQHLVHLWNQVIDRIDDK